MSLLSDLKGWREKRAAAEGVESYRVFPNATLEEIVRQKPSSTSELMTIKGIKEAKCRKYGADILKMVAMYGVGEAVEDEGSDSQESRIEKKESSKGKFETKKKETIIAGEFSSVVIQDKQEGVEVADQTLSVSQFLDEVNLELSGMAARVRGEVTSFDERERVVYFSIKDMKDGSTLPCLIFRSAYAMSGVRMAIGDEVIVEGAPEVWKPMGKLSFKCAVVEYAGEGTLKKAYDALFAKLSAEGLLAPERKRAIPMFPTRIALLTSRDGAAIGDFMMNVGRHGYTIDLYASSVEGARAVPELLAGVRYFNRHAEDYDVLVIIRGGGSLESLQAFNNEMLVREIVASPIPVIAGIGHEKDITLATLVADAGVSTPTAASRLVRQSWEDGAERVLRAEHSIRGTFSEAIDSVSRAIGDSEVTLADVFREMKERIRTLLSRFMAKRETVLYAIRGASETIVNIGNILIKGKNEAISDVSGRLSQFEKSLQQYDPTRALNLGYSLVRLGNGRILRASTEANVGDRLDIRLAKGNIGAEVKEITD